MVAAGATLRTDETAAQVLATAEAAVVGISSVVDEAAILGVPVMVPAGPLADAGLEALLPPAVAYPRIASARDLVDQVLAWRGDAVARTAAIERQGDTVRRRIRIDADHGAARRAATAIVASARAR